MVSENSRRINSPESFDIVSQAIVDRPPTNEAP